MKKEKRNLIILVSILASVIISFSIVVYGIYWAFFDIQRIDGQEVLTVSQSPNATYIVTAYLNNGGATTDYAVLCSVKNSYNGKERNIYWNYHCSNATIFWIDDTQVSINGTILNVARDTYDYRRS